MAGHVREITPNTSKESSSLGDAYRFVACLPFTKRSHAQDNKLLLKPDTGRNECQTKNALKKADDRVILNTIATISVEHIHNRVYNCLNERNNFAVTIKTVFLCDSFPRWSRSLKREKMLTLAQWKFITARTKTWARDFQ
jgi:hypothetical protein